MPQVIDYLIKLSGTLMVLYLFYWLVLRRLTFYTCNRWYLMGYSLAAFLLPLVNIGPLLENTDRDLVQWVPIINTAALDDGASTHTKGLSWQTDLVIISFVFGVLIMVVRFCIQYLSVRTIRKTSRLISDGEVKVYHSNKKIIPFSFGNSIFINKDTHSEDDLRDIIRHEFIHVKQRHTVDIILSEWICILNWYNPFAWLIRNAIRQNLEFIADHQVLENGVDKKQYQYLLLKVVGVDQYAIATSFNFASLKKRIAMMNKMRSAKLHLVKFLFVLPLLVVVLLAFRNKDDNPPLQLETISSAIILPDQRSNDILIRDTIPAPKKTAVSRANRIVEPNNKGYVITIADNNGECLVIIRDKQNKIVKAMSLVDWNENEKQFTNQYGQIPPPPPPVEPPVPPVPAEAPFSNEDISEINIKDSRLTIVLKNGQTEIYDLDKPEQKALFDKKYDLKKEVGNFRMQMRKETMKVDTAGKVLVNTFGDFDGLILVDDKEYDKKTFERDVVLAPTNIRSVEVFKGDATKTFGEKGKNGVIRIVTKQTSED